MGCCVSDQTFTTCISSLADSEEDAFDFGAGAAGGSALSNRLMESMQALLRAEEVSTGASGWS